MVKSRKIEEIEEENRGRRNRGKGDKKSARYRIIKRIIGVKDDIYGRGLHSNPDPNSLIERLELLILETKAGHGGLYEEMLDLSEQLLSMNIFNQEQLDNFVFNYGN